MEKGVEEGLEKGLEEGLEKGLEEGPEEGVEASCFHLGRAGGSQVAGQTVRRRTRTGVVAALLATAGTVVLLTSVYMVILGLASQLGKVNIY